MTIIVNGKELQIPDRSTLETVMVQLGLNPANSVCMVNGELAAPENYGATVLHDADRLDVLAFVGGG